MVSLMSLLSVNLLTALAKLIQIQAYFLQKKKEAYISPTTEAYHNTKILAFS